MALAAYHAAGRAPWAAAAPGLAPRRQQARQRRAPTTGFVLRATKAPRGGKQRAGVQEGAQDSGSGSVIMGTIQALLARAKEQQAVANRLRPSNAALAVELKTKAEQHLHTLMQLAEKAPDAAAAEPDLLAQLTALSQQLELEQEAARTAASAAEASSSSGGGAANRARGHSTSSSGARSTTSTSSSSSENDVLQTRLAEAEAAAASLQRQLADANATLQATADELHEHRDLQMAYDRQCQDMYKLRMQLQQAEQQGSAAAASAAQVVRQHKQDLSWLMQAHQKELNDAHRKHQELIQETQALRLKVLEQEQLLWGRGAATPADDAAAPAAAASEAVVAAAAPAAAASRSSSQAAPSAGDDAAAAAAADLQLQQDQHQLQQLQGELEQLSAEKQQLVKSLQDSQREQAVLLVELQHMRDAAAADSAAAAAADASASSSIEAAVAAARAEGAAVAEQQLMQRLTSSEQQRDKLVRQLQELEASLAEAKAAAAAAAAAPADVQPAAAAAASSAALSSRLDTAAAVEQLKVVKVQMAELRVQLAAARRELREVAGRAEAAEARLQQQAAGYESRLAKLQAWYGKQAAVVAELRKGRAPRDGQVGFTNANRFWVPSPLLFDFLKHWVSREAALQQQEGFLGLQVQPAPAPGADGGVEVVVTSLWEDIPAWEAWHGTAAATQAHLPSGVMQYVPAKGEGFPEPFTPFRDYDAAVNAKYA